MHRQVAGPVVLDTLFFSEKIKDVNRHQSKPGQHAKHGGHIFDLGFEPLAQADHTSPQGIGHITDLIGIQRNAIFLRRAGLGCGSGGLRGGCRLRRVGAIAGCGWRSIVWLAILRRGFGGGCEPIQDALKLIGHILLERMFLTEGDVFVDGLLANLRNAFPQFFGVLDQARDKRRKKGDLQKEGHGKDHHDGPGAPQAPLFQPTHHRIEQVGDDAGDRQGKEH